MAGKMSTRKLPGTTALAMRAVCAWMRAITGLSLLLAGGQPYTAPRMFEAAVLAQVARGEGERGRRALRCRGDVLLEPVFPRFRMRDEVQRGQVGLSFLQRVVLLRRAYAEAFVPGAAHLAPAGRSQDEHARDTCQEKTYAHVIVRSEDHEYSPGEDLTGHDQTWAVTVYAGFAVCKQV